MTKPYLAPKKLMKLWVVLVVIVLMLSIVAAKNAGGIAGVGGRGSGSGRTRVIGAGGGGSHGRSSSASSLGGAKAWRILTFNRKRTKSEIQNPNSIIPVQSQKYKTKSISSLRLSSQFTSLIKSPSPTKPGSSCGLQSPEAASVPVRLRRAVHSHRILV
ncbi:hypothetical protein QYF36_018342 [Acer negundo]|nr:hypothetical protein QYF36_018342 [Acer negundo]